MMQQPCNTDEGQKTMFSHPATNEVQKKTFSDVCKSEGTQAAHAATPVPRTGYPPYQRRTTVSAILKQHLGLMGPHSSFKKCTRGVS